MGFVRIFWENNIQEAYLPKMSISGQIVSDIIAQLCSENSIQTLLDIVLSEYPDKSHDFRNFIFMTSHLSTLLRIVYWRHQRAQYEAPARSIEFD